MNRIATLAEINAAPEPIKGLAKIALLSIVDNCLGTKRAEKIAKSEEELSIVSRLYLNDDRRVPIDLQAFVCNHCNRVVIGAAFAANHCRVFSEKEIA